MAQQQRGGERRAFYGRGGAGNFRKYTLHLDIRDLVESLSSKEMLTLEISGRPVSMIMPVRKTSSIWSRGSGESGRRGTFLTAINNLFRRNL